jgi:hypothetical protein
MCDPYVCLVCVPVPPGAIRYGLHAGGGPAVNGATVDCAICMRLVPRLVCTDAAHPCVFEPTRLALG